MFDNFDDNSKLDSISLQKSKDGLRLLVMELKKKWEGLRKILRSFGAQCIYLLSPM